MILKNLRIRVVLVHNPEWSIEGKTDGNSYTLLRISPSRYLELVCSTMSQQYDNLYGFEGLQRLLFGIATIPSVTFRSVSIEDSFASFFCLHFLLSPPFFYSFAFSFFYLSFCTWIVSARHQRGFIAHSAISHMDRSAILFNPYQHTLVADSRVFEPLDAISCR